MRVGFTKMIEKTNEHWRLPAQIFSCMKKFQTFGRKFYVIFSLDMAFFAEANTKIIQTKDLFRQ